MKSVLENLRAVKDELLPLNNKDLGFFCRQMLRSWRINYNEPITNNDEQLGQQFRVYLLLDL